MKKMKIRKRSVGYCGGAFGDEGKGRVVDEKVNHLAKFGPVIVFRDNGGANAGHTIELENGTRVALHQLPSGIFCQEAIVILGKGMVIHPNDLVSEIEKVRTLAGTKMSRIMVDEMAVLSLDTHRAYEFCLKKWEEGGKGSTGRGISPAYADVLYRHPLRIRDLMRNDKEKIDKHYKLYEAFASGLGEKLEKIKVPVFGSDEMINVGTLDVFRDRLLATKNKLEPYVADLGHFIRNTWRNMSYSFVIEKSQAVGLDYRYGVYPDVTASDTTFEGAVAASEGVIDVNKLEKRVGVIKATYMSSVGSRILPTVMEEKRAVKIREDANEYGATTKRPRGIAYLDLPALKFYRKVGKITSYVLTHMDIVYKGEAIKVCVGYKKNNETVEYRPDQEFLLEVTPEYREFPSWSKVKLQKAKKYDEIPIEAKRFIRFLEKELRARVLMITTGPKRNQTVVVKRKNNY